MRGEWKKLKRDLLQGGDISKAELVSTIIVCFDMSLDSVIASRKYDKQTLNTISNAYSYSKAMSEIIKNCNIHKYEKNREV